MAATGTAGAGGSKEQILGYLHHQGHATVQELAKVVGMTATGMRQHLTALSRDGLVAATEMRGHVGRPALVYTLTPRGEGRFPTNYAMLVNLLLEEVRTMAGADALQRLLRRVSARMADSYGDRLLGRSVHERIETTAQDLREQGSDIEVSAAGDEFFIRQCTCPYPEVARRHSAVCALEVDFVQRMTGADARLVGSLLRGDSACSYRVRPTTAGPPRRA